MPYKPSCVAFVPYNGVALDTKGLPLQKWKRRAIWHNIARNKLIAEVAADLAKNYYKTLRELGLKVADVSLPVRKQQHVVVLAETAEHARRIGFYLPGWELQDAIPMNNDEEGYDEAVDPKLYHPIRTITTLMYVAQNGISCNILVRATAGTGKLYRDNIRDGKNGSNTKPGLIVDFRDKGDKDLQLHAEIRRREYQEQGFNDLQSRRTLSPS